MTKESESNEWWSDKEWYENICDTYEIYPKFDAAATHESTKCPEYFDKIDNALEREWKIENPVGIIVDIWCNPPLNKGLCRKFVLKAEEQWRKHNMNIMMPVPAGVISRQYFRHLWDEFVKNQGKTVFLDPIDRPKFLLNGKKKTFARNDYMMLIFKKQ